MPKAALVVALIVCLAFVNGCTAPRAHQSPDRTNQALLEKQLADANKKIEEIYHRVSVIQFMVDNHQRSLRELEKQLSAGPVDEPMEADSAAGAPQAPASLAAAPDEAAADTFTGDDVATATPDAPAPPEPEPKTSPDAAEEDAAAMYAHAQTAFKAKRFDVALKRFEAMARKHPTHDLADNALYWAGECHYTQKEYQEAIASFKKVILKYPDGSKVPDALLKTGYAYLSLNDKVNARIYLKEVIKSYPFSAAGAKAETMLERIRNE